METTFDSDLNRFYQEILNDLVDDESDVSYNARKLEGKVMNHFRDQIQLARTKSIQGNMIYNKKYTTEEAIRLSNKQNIHAKMRYVALF